MLVIILGRLRAGGAISDMISNEARGNLAPKNGCSTAPSLDMLRN
jgi:hypothetical protein